MTDDLKEMLRKIPAVDQLLIRPEVEQLLTEFPRSIVVEKARAVVEGARQSILAGLSQAKAELLEMSALTQLLRTEVLEAGKPHLRPVINATGVVLHTNLGRAVLSQSAMQAVQQVAVGYSNLELDLTTGERGSRYDHVEELLKRLTGA